MIRLRPLRIGQLAAQLNINPKTIRYYEQIGLLPVAQRTRAGYRIYSYADRERLGFIVKARKLGLTLEDIAKILAVREQGGLPCEQVVTLLEQKLAAVDEQIRVLVKFREELLQLCIVTSKGEACDGAICGIVEGCIHDFASD